MCLTTHKILTPDVPKSATLLWKRNEAVLHTKYTELKREFLYIIIPPNCYFVCEVQSAHRTTNVGLLAGWRVVLFLECKVVLANLSIYHRLRLFCFRFRFLKKISTFRLEIIENNGRSAMAHESGFGAMSTYKSDNKSAISSSNTSHKAVDAILIIRTCKRAFEAWALKVSNNNWLRTINRYVYLAA